MIFNRHSHVHCYGCIRKPVKASLQRIMILKPWFRRLVAHRSALSWRLSGAGVFYRGDWPLNRANTVFMSMESCLAKQQLQLMWQWHFGNFPASCKCLYCDLNSHAFEVKRVSAMPIFRGKYRYILIETVERLTNSEVEGIERLIWLTTCFVFCRRIKDRIKTVMNFRNS